MVPRFTPEDAQRDEVRPHLQGFDAKRYTNPTMMYDALHSIGLPWHKVGPEWPCYGLARVQWEGPWTQPGVPMRARYRYTHWVAGWDAGAKGYGVYDCNAMANGTGWGRREDWEREIVPWILREAVPRSNGRWHITHGIEVQTPDARR